MIEAVIGGDTYSVANVDVKYSVCKHKGSALFEMDFRELSNINTFDTVVISADGTTMFTGFVDSIEYGNFPYSLSITAVSQLVKVERTWFAREYISSGQSAASWIGTFMGLAQISGTDVSVGATIVYEGHSWSFSTCMEAILNLCQLTNSRLYSTRTGTVAVKPTNTSGVADYTVTNYESLDIVFSTAVTRNKARVFGTDGIMAEASGANSYLVAGEERTIAISSGLIRTQATAARIASELMANFNVPMQVYSFTVEGQPQLSLNDYIVYGSVGGAITSLRHLYNDEKFITEITIGEICPSFFGIDIIGYPYLYLSTVSNGVWKSSEDGLVWTDISGATLAGATVPAIHWDGIYLWAITSTGVYRGNGEGTWTSCNILSTYYVTKAHIDYVIEKANLELIDIISNYSNSSRIYVLAYDSVYQKTLVLFSDDKSNFNRIFMV